MKHLFLIALFLCSQQIMSQGPNQRQEMNLDEVFNLYDVNGENILVVIIDRGIDYKHPDFIDDNGDTRIAYIYDMIDQSGASDADNPYGVGTIFDQVEINNSLDNNTPHLTNDRYGHGTATTGIICGNGSGSSDSSFEGIASKATIISIKITHDYFPAFGDQPEQAGSFDITNIPIALQFATDKIQEMGIPSVTLMNIGSIGGPTDGTSLICQKINEFVSAGNTFVCGVGDDGGADNAAKGTVNANESLELLIDKADAGFLRLDLWYSENDRFTVSIERPGGALEGPFTAPTGPTQANDQFMTGIAMYHRGADTEFFGATSNRRELLIDFSGETGTYKIILQGESISDSGEFIASLNPSGFYNSNKFISNVVPGYSINDFASADSCITPGDYVIKNDWVNMAGNTIDITGQGEEGELWVGSSSGPTHSESLGIDFVTPGEVCYAAYSPDTWYSNADFNLIQGGNNAYGIQNAVSAAAPLATGVIALMLQVNPNLSPAQIKSLLQASCKSDAFTGTVPNNDWGHGKLDALQAIQNTINTTKVNELTESVSTIGLFPNPFQNTLSFQTKDVGELIESIEIYNSLGQLIWNKKNIHNSQFKGSFNFLDKGNYWVVSKVDGKKIVQQVIKD